MSGLFARTRHYLEEQRLQPDINRGLRATVGFMGAFFAALWLNLPIEASFAAIAAQNIAMVDIRGSYPLRLSLLLVMTAIFFLTWFAQSLNNWREFNDDAREHGDQAIAWSTFLGRADFWERTLENWQSEFLAVGTMAVFTIYLRQRGSPESKPVGAPHDETASSG